MANYLWIQRKYINIISSRLRNFKWKSEKLANCSCPFCGDSKKNKFKARFYFIRKEKTYYVHCHNCDAHMSLESFLFSIDKNIHSDYTEEKIKEKYTLQPTKEETSNANQNCTIIQPQINLKKISQLPNDHIAKKYVLHRQIPASKHYKIYYTNEFKKWVNTFLPGKFRKESEDQPRIVLPFFNEKNDFFYVQSRAINSNSGDLDRYITITIDDSKPKIYGLDTINFSKKHYIVEGPIDSLFLDNCIAMAGSDIPLNFVNENSVFVYDNEPKNKELHTKMRKIIDKGYNIFIWPYNNVEKKEDINDLILKGILPNDIQKMIDENTYSGIKAIVKMMEWKKR